MAIQKRKQACVVKPMDGSEIKIKLVGADMDESQPIIFEEVFTLDRDVAFFNLVKQSSELIESKIIDS